MNEEEELKAQKAFYDEVEKNMRKRLTKKLAYWQKVSLVYMPGLALVFAVSYWIAGLKHANII